MFPSSVTHLTFDNYIPSIDSLRNLPFLKCLRVFLEDKKWDFEDILISVFDKLDLEEIGVHETYFDEENDLVIDKNNILLSCESLLDFATELNFEKRYLDFHYRSRHPFLIDFSNHAFYNKRLKPLPNNFEYVPIKYIQVNLFY
jgi:hypothetical protein